MTILCPTQKTTVETLKRRISKILFFVRCGANLNSVSLYLASILVNNPCAMFQIKTKKCHVLLTFSYNLPE